MVIRIWLGSINDFKVTEKFQTAEVVLSTYNGRKCS